jgi:hypothetical protein
MRSRLRSLDSKISFFAFADIITAVSGMLIFITLLLATDLDRPADNSQGGDPETVQRLQETLRQQGEADAENRRLQELFAAAETAPASEKLELDILRLRSQVSEERQKQTTLAAQLDSNQAATQARDRTLGLTDLKAAIQRMVQEAESVARQEAQVRGEMSNLEQQVARVQSQLLKVRQRAGQLWLIPDKTANTKEPILVTVSGPGAIAERFDHPDQLKKFEKVGAVAAFQAYLREARTLDQYVVFLVRPSGIGLFEDLVKSARDMGFEVGFDALEKDRQIHFSSPPAADEPAPPTNAPSAPSDQRPSVSGGTTGLPTNAAPAAAPAQQTQPLPSTASGAQASAKPKSWWQRFLQWIGIS